MTQPAINLKVAFWPVHRATPDDFWLALGVIAVLDAVRLTLTPAAGLLSWAVIAFFVACAFINRLRDAGRMVGLAVVPLGAATLVKLVAGLFGMMSVAYPEFIAFLQSQGVDLNDPVSVQAAAYDAEIQRAYQAHLTSDPEHALAILKAGAWPSAWGFWLTLALSGLWATRR